MNAKVDTNATMNAAHLTAIRKIEIRTAPRPRIERPDDVLLRIDTVGVCGSDLHYYREGRIGSQVVQFPWIIGHECAGVVEQVGPGVQGLAVGQRVAVEPLIACGKCDQCRAGREHTCRDQQFLGCPGQLPGSMAQFLRMPQRCCLPIPDSMSFDRAVLTEPFSIALWAVSLAGATVRKKIVVLGSGPIGLCVTAALKAAGQCQVLATDLLPERVKLARQMGADWSGLAVAGGGDASRPSLHDDDADLVFECAGKSETLDQGVRLLAPGGRLMIVGIPSTDRISFDMNLIRRKELNLQNVRRQNQCQQRAIEMIASGQVNLDPLVTHHFPLADSQKAFDLVADYRDGVIKAMIRLS